MPEPHEQHWDQLGARAAARDDALGGGYDAPLRALVSAAANTDLRRYRPFTSHDRFCLTETGPPEGALSAHIQFRPSGEFWVMRGSPYDDERERILVVRDPHDAVRGLLEQLDLPMPD
jgi:hypothetical protein